MVKRRALSGFLVLLLSVGILCATAAQAQVAKQGNDGLSALAFTGDKLQISQPLEPFDDVQSLVATKTQSGWAAFRLGNSVEWQAAVDKRTGQVGMAEGGGIAWIPGNGNKLSAADISAVTGGTGKVTMASMESIARAFLPRVAGLIGVDPASLVLNQGRSGQPASHVWFVDFDVVQGGLPIEGARVLFRINNGNLVQFGTENLPAPGVKVPEAKLSRDKALAALAAYIGGTSEQDKWIDSGSLHLLPTNVTDNRFGDGVRFAGGRDLAKAWQFIFHRDGIQGTWRARVDARNGEILDFTDTNDYAQATGGIFPISPTVGAEVVRAAPFANLTTGGATNSAGLFTAVAGAASTLNGTYVRIIDSCGAISQAADGSGNIVFGTSAGTDCTTPGHGGAGNTHATREQFYWVNRIKEVGRGWLPTNAWLNAKLTVNVNLNQTCNAYWQSATGTLNFFKSGGGCGNTGEIASVSLHEYGHGLDSNDGTSPTDGGTGEAMGDTTAVIALHTSCIGAGFRASNCAGYGDACTSCTGVRDVDWAKHASNTPATVNGFTRVRCPAGSGPCGKEVHCESYVGSEAIWDFANRDLPSPGTGSAYTVLDRLWYLSRGTSNSAFACTTGATFTSNGCGSGSWWKAMRAVDDDDGNLTNGTPHSCSLFAAFNRHGIACTTDAGANTCFSGCTPPAAPSLGLTAGTNSVAVAVAGTGVFDIYRNETGCNAGFTKAANDNTTGAFTDPNVANGTTYFYQAIAHPSGNEACSSAPSTCLSVVPVTGTCTPPGAPTGLTATASGTATINLSWTAVAGATEYHILRSATSGGPYTQIGTSATTSFSDTPLACSTAFFYVVRAANSPSCESGNSAQATATTGTCPVCHTATLYTKGFESPDTGLAGWTTGTFVSGGSTASWRGVQTCTAQTGTKIFRFGGTACTTDYANNNFSFAQPNGAAGISVPAGATATQLTFGHRRAFESGFDGGTLTVSVDGANYEFVPASAITGTTYNNTSSGGPTGSSGAPVFSGTTTTFANTTVNLDAACNLASGTTGGCAGRAVRIGFTAISDTSVTGDGWFLDNVVVTACVP